MQRQGEGASTRLITPETFQRTCRICFVEESLFNTRTSMYEDHTIEEILASLINVDELDIQENFAHIVYPEFICLGCVNQLIYTTLFLDQCYKAHETLSKVYTYLTLYQHKSVIISKPFYLYKSDDAMISQKCKLIRRYPKITVELKRAILRKSEEEKIANKNENDKPIQLENKLTITKRLALNRDIKSRNKKRRVTKHYRMLQQSAKVEISTNTKRNNESTSAEENLPQIKPAVNNSISLLDRKLKPRKRLDKSRKTIDTSDCQRNIERSKNGCEIPLDRKLISRKRLDKSRKRMVTNDYQRNIERIKNGREPVPGNYFMTNYFHENDRKIEKLYAMYLENVKKASDSDGRFTNDPECQLVDVKEELVEDNEVCKPIDWEIEELAQEIRGNVYEKIDTGQVCRDLADINKDRQNIDLDHCYTNKDMFKNTRFIMPKVNFHRVNDLLYPAPDIAKKKDKVLAGKISERMASILSGNSPEKMDGGFNFAVETFEELLKVAKNEPEDKIFDNLDYSRFIKPECVELNATGFNLLDLIKIEPKDDENLDDDCQMYE